MNRIIYADDCLNVLNDKSAISDKSVDLIYLDPPFNSKNKYNLPFKDKLKKDTKPVEAFKDTWNWDEPEAEQLRKLELDIKTKHIADIIKFARTVHNEHRPSKKISTGAYLINIAIRLIAMKRVLKKTGSIYLHCDPTASHYIKVIMDSIFGSKNYKNDIVWKRTDGKGLNPTRYLKNCDRLLYYSNGGKHVWNQQYQPFDPSYGDNWHEDEIGYWEAENLTGGKAGSPEAYMPFKDVYPSSGRAWAPPVREKFPPNIKLPDNYEKLNALEKCLALDEVGLIYWPAKQGGMPRYKKYLSTLKGKYVSDLIYDISPISSQSEERLGYPTQKPIKLLERIIKASSNENDVILDPFCGCGTAIYVAEKLRRKWIGIDISTFSAGLMRERITSNFPHLKVSSVRVVGVPLDVVDAKQLARRDPFEFEKWVRGAIGAHGMFHEPGSRGSDGGVDGVINFALFKGISKKVKPTFALVQVKSGKVNPDSVRALTHSVNYFGAQAGIMVCFQDYMTTVENNRLKGTFGDLTGTYPIIQGFSIEQLLKEERPILPPLLVRGNANLIA